jgi:hypothetical protein
LLTLDAYPAALPFYEKLAPAHQRWHGEGWRRGCARRRPSPRTPGVAAGLAAVPR